MEKLETLASVARLSDRVLRVLGQNPSKFTLQGTNTYLIGRGNPWILLDTGEGKDSYIPCLNEALTDSTVNPSLPLISDIVLTHRHGDHTQGLPSVLAFLRRLWGEKDDFRPPRIHKFPSLPTTSDAEMKPMLDGLPSHLYSSSPLAPPTAGGGPIHPLQISQTLRGSDATLHVIHTPGHTSDSICLYLAEEMSLFAGDTILGQGTAVFEDLAAYMDSLRSLLDFNNNRSTGERFVKVYPGHGPVVDDGPNLIANYIQHRMEREDQIVALLSSTPPSGEMWTLGGLVAKIYAEYPQSLWAPAAGGMRLHLAKLEKEGKVRYGGGEMQDSRWTLTTKL